MEARSRVRDAVEHYADLLAKHEQTMREQLAEATERLDLRYRGKRPLCNVLRPHIVGARVYEESCRAARLVGRAILHFTERLIADREAARAAGFPDYLQPMLDVDRHHGAAPAFARVDGMLDASGVIRFIEYNSAPGYIYETHELDELFSAMPIAHELAGRFPFRTVPTLPLAFDAVREHHRRRGGEGAPTVALIRDTIDSDSNEATLWAHAAAWDCHAMTASLDELRLVDGRLTAHERAIDHVVMHRGILFDPRLDARPLADAIRTGAVTALHGVSRAAVASAKILFESLSDPTCWEGLDGESKAALAKHVPWTRRVRPCKTGRHGATIDLIPYVAEHRADFALKPSSSHGGTGVVLGWTVDDARWQVELKKAQTRPTVVQERVSSPSESYPVLEGESVTWQERRDDFNVYVWNGRHAAGYFVRLTGGELHNLASGSGSLTAKWILER